MKYFSATPPSIEISTDTAALVTITATTDDGAELPLYSETLTPADGQITLDDLSGLFTPYARQYFHLLVTVSAPSTSYGTQTFDLYHGELVTSLSCEEFLSKHFLTTYDGQRRTSPHRREYLYYCLDTADPLYKYSVIAQICLSNGKTVRKTGTSSASGRVYCIDASPAFIINAAKDELEADPEAFVMSYTIEVNNKSQEYVIDYDEPDCPAVISFINPFGCREFVYPAGRLQASPTYARSTTRIRGQLSNYDIQETRTFKLALGPLTTDEAAWIDDLFRSLDTWLCQKQGSTLKLLREIVITDSKSDQSTADDDLPAYTLEFVYAQPCHNVLNLSRSGRVFSDAFDDSFG